VPVIFSSHQLDLVERLCDTVAIIDRGRLVASGGVDDLRRTGRDRRYRVDVAGSTSAWVDGPPGVAVLQKNGSSLLLRLDETTDDHLVLASVRRAGDVTHFGAVEPTLSDLYREAVTR